MKRRRFFFFGLFVIFSLFKAAFYAQMENKWCLCRSRNPNNESTTHEFVGVRQNNRKKKSEDKEIKEKFHQPSASRVGVRKFFPSSISRTSGETEGWREREWRRAKIFFVRPPTSCTDSPAASSSNTGPRSQERSVLVHIAIQSWCCIIGAMTRGVFDCAFVLLYKADGDFMNKPSPHNFYCHCRSGVCRRACECVCVRAATNHYFCRRLVCWTFDFIFSPPIKHKIFRGLRKKKKHNLHWCHWG